MSRFARVFGALALLGIIVACEAPQAGRVENSVEPQAPSATAEADVEADPTIGPTAAEPPAPTLAPRTASVITDANVRDQPTTEGSNILTQVRTGETVQLVMRDEGGSWYGVVDPRGGRGWVSASLLIIDPQVAAQVPVGDPADLAPVAPEAETVEAPPPAAAPAEGYPSKPEGLTEARVVKVVDGDTLDVSLGGETERLRLIGLDTPETVDPRKPVQCFGREASAKAHELLDGQMVWLEDDPSQDSRDRYGRRLAYVWLPGDTLYNLEMIGMGYAHEYTYETPYKYQARFKQEEQGAADRGWGLWATTTCNGNTELAADPEPSPAAPPPVQ